MNEAGTSVPGPVDPRSDQILRAIVETSDDAIFTIAQRTQVTSWTPTAERLFGMLSADVLGKPIDQLFPEHLRPGLRSVSSRVLSGERIKHFESEIIRADGLPLPVWLSLCPITDRDDRPEGALVVARDVTEQHLAQATLAEVENRLRDAEALSHVGSWLWDVRTGAVQWSTELHRIHGVDPFEFDGTFTSHLLVIHPDDRARVRAGMERSVSSASPFESEHRILRGDGALRLVSVRAHPSIGSDGKAVGLRGVAQDVTDGPDAASIASHQVSDPGHDVSVGYGH